MIGILLSFEGTPENLARYTAAEIKHGRIAMIATIGYLMPDLFRFPGSGATTSRCKALRAPLVAAPIHYLTLASAPWNGPPSRAPRH